MTAASHLQRHKTTFTNVMINKYVAIRSKGASTVWYIGHSIDDTDMTTLKRFLVSKMSFSNEKKRTFKA